jgi:hypothetical protein
MLDLFSDSVKVIEYLSILTNRTFTISMAEGLLHIRYINQDNNRHGRQLFVLP